MNSAGWKSLTLAVIAAVGVGAFAIYTLAWHNSDSESDRKAETERTVAIDRVSLHAKQSCEAPWWEDDYCVRRVKATRFTAKDGGEGFWLVREHVRGDKPLQDTCWLVEPDRPSRHIEGGWPNTGLRPWACDCPDPNKVVRQPPPPAPRDSSKLDTELVRVLSVLCPGWPPAG